MDTSKGIEPSVKRACVETKLSSKMVLAQCRISGRQLDSELRRLQRTQLTRDPRRALRTSSDLIFIFKDI